MEPQNAFQALMRRWTSLGPYNALHLMRIAGRPDLERWREAAGPLLIELGIQLPPCIGTAYHELAAGISAELSKPFSTGESPLRFFVIPDGDEAHHFGVTFDHWIADSQSVRLLMQRIFASYQTPGSGLQLPPLRVCDTPFAKLFGSANWLGATAECVQSYFRHLRAYRIRIRDPLNFSSGFQYFPLPDGLIDEIRRCGKRHGASVNDIFLAAATQALGSHTAAGRAGKLRRTFGTTRDRVGFSVAVDIRPLARKPLDNVFGFFLSYYSTLVQNPETMPLADLAKQIAAHTKTMKSKRHTLRFFQGFRLANLFWSIYRQPRRRALMFYRTVPLLGGISNVNLTDSWIGRDGRVLDYIRVSPTGPLLPIVFTLTTIHNRLSLCVTHRHAFFTHEQAAAIAVDFRQRLTAL